MGYYNSKPSMKKREDILEVYKYLADLNRKGKDYKPAIVDIGRGQVMMGDLATLAGVDENDISNNTNTKEENNHD